MACAFLFNLKRGLPFHDMYNSTLAGGLSLQGVQQFFLSLTNSDAHGHVVIDDVTEIDYLGVAVTATTEEVMPLYGNDVPIPPLSPGSSVLGLTSGTPSTSGNNDIILQCRKETGVIGTEASHDSSDDLVTKPAKLRSAAAVTSTVPQLSGWSSVLLTDSGQPVMDRVTRRRPLRRYQTKQNLASAIHHCHAEDDADLNECSDYNNEAYSRSVDGYARNDDNSSDDVSSDGNGCVDNSELSSGSSKNLPKHIETFVISEEYLVSFIPSDIQSLSDIASISQPENILLKQKDSLSKMARVRGPLTSSCKSNNSDKRGKCYNIRNQTIVSIGDSASSIEPTTSDSGVDSEGERISQLEFNISGQEPRCHHHYHQQQQQQQPQNGEGRNKHENPVSDSFDLYKYVIGEMDNVKSKFPKTSARFETQNVLMTDLIEPVVCDVQYPLECWYENRQKETRKPNFRLSDLLLCGCSARKQKTGKPCKTHVFK